MKPDFANASQTFKRLNPHLFGALGAVEARQPEPHSRSALVNDAAPSKGRETGVAVRVVFTAHLARPMDDDNLTAALKPLRDAVAASLGIDDGDGRVEWVCLQVQDECEGVSVKVGET